DTLVDRAVSALVGPRPEAYARFRGGDCLEHPSRAVGRAVVDTEDLAGAHRLRKHALDRRTHEAIVVVDRDHYRDVGRRRIARRSLKSETHHRLRLPRSTSA